MPLHDDYARRTPFELVFPDPAGVRRLVSEVEEEAHDRGADASDFALFLTLEAVGSFLRELRAPDADPRAMHSFGALAYHCVHFERAGRPLYLLEAAAARYLVGGAPGGQPSAPATAGYLQLPLHLFWLEEGGGQPESVDGVFWTIGRSDELHAALAIGMRAGRPGLGLVAAPAAPAAHAPSWLEATVRESGRDFEASMPGAELEGLLAFRAAGEILKLLARLFAYLAAVPSAARAVEPSTDAGPPPPSTLAYRRVSLDG